MPKSFLVRAHSIHVEAGLLDKLKSAAKKMVVTLIGVGVFTSIAQGGIISQTGLKKGEKVFNQEMEKANIDVKLKTSYTPGKGNTGKVVYVYTDNTGSKAEIIFIQHPAGNYLDAKVYKPKDGSPVSEDINYIAKTTYDSLHKELLGEGIQLKHK